MQGIPDSVRHTFQRLKQEYKFYIALSRINGKYYVYRHTTRWDKESRKVRSISKYLGKIDENGIFVQKAIIKEEVIGYPVKLIKKEETTDPIEEKLLRFMSMNSRLGISELSARIGVSQRSTYSKIKSLEKKYSIKYVPEIDVERLGYSKFVALVKFSEIAPPLEELDNALRNNPRIQLVMLTKGYYDLIIYFLAENSFEASELVYRLVTDKDLGKYKLEWEASPFAETNGFVPLRKEFFDLLKRRVWIKSRERPRRDSGQLLSREYLLLSELNANGAVPFNDIDKRHGLGKGSSQYTYHKLKETGVIKRSTIALEGLNLKYNAIIFIKIIEGSKFLSTQKNLLLDIIKDTESPINAYSLAGDITAPYSIFLFMPVFYEGELEESIARLNEKVGGLSISALVCTKSLFGSVCYRKFDNSYTIQYENLIRKHSVTPQKRALYD